jgi:Uma2 family endonuclease
MYAADRSFSGQPENARRRIGRIHFEVIEDSGRGSAWISINLTDREEDWIYNHRCPDGAVILRSNPRRWVGERQAAFFGGPDLVLEILSEGEDVRTKLPFYRDLKVREVLIVDPETGSPELWGLQGEGYRKVEGPSAVTGLEYRKSKKGFRVRDNATGRDWEI